MATHSSILAWRIPWKEEPDYSSLGHKESDTTEQTQSTQAQGLGGQSRPGAAGLILELIGLSGAAVSFIKNTTCFNHTLHLSFLFKDSYCITQGNI